MEAGLVAQETRVDLENGGPGAGQAKPLSFQEGAERFDSRRKITGPALSVQGWWFGFVSHAFRSRPVRGFHVPP